MINDLATATQYFEKIAQAESRDWRDQFWIGEIENCDVCSRPMEDDRYMIDGPASHEPNAPWGNLCVICAYKYSPKIEYGFAQLYQMTDEGMWKLVSGGNWNKSDI
jgi:hypothetical protein